MQYTVKAANPARQRTACVVVGIFETHSMSAHAVEVDHASSGALAALLRRGDIEGKPGRTLLLHDLPGVAAERVLLVGCGPKGAISPASYAKALTAAAQTLAGTGAGEATFFLPDMDVDGRDLAWRMRHAVTGIEDGIYRFEDLKAESSRTRHRLRRVTLAVTRRGDVRPGEIGMHQGMAVSTGVNVSRDLGNLPGNICTPSYLADRARDMQTRGRLKVSVLEKKDMEKLRMGALLAVARGSRQPPKLIVLEYTNGPAGEPPVALVGKGLTFDAGGISIKPAAKMDEMKYDMCGGAGVLGVMAALLELELPMNVVGVIPSSENLPDGDANKPGDIIRSMSGQTIEVLNTDAEGRLILCDAFTYTQRFKPACVIDLATLTGACVVALGSHASGLMSPDDALAAELLEAGETSLDRAWRLPLWDDYHSALDSNFADMANVGGRDAGAITAGCFLARYASSFRWAHLDIAGTAWNTGKEKGSTGRPVPLLLEFLRARAAGRSGNSA